MSRKTPGFTAIIALCSLFFTSHGNAQDKVSWGDEFKMHRGSTDLTILRADPSGVYMIESHPAVKSYFVVGFTTRNSGTLVKLTPTMTEQYRNDFDKELRGKEYDRLLFMHDKLYLFATDYSKKDNSLYLYAAEVDKATGNLKGDWQQIYAWEKIDKSEKIDYNIGYNSDSSRLVLTGTYSGRSQNRYEIKMMDAGLRLVGKPLVISNEFDPKTFQVEDFVYTATGNAILVGRIYEYEEGKKKKDKNLVFKNYNIRLYDPQGKMIGELVTDIDNKYLVTGKVLQLKNELVLAAFYSNDRRKKQINGLMVQRLDPATGKVLVSSKMDLNTTLISEVEDDDADKNSRKKDDADDEGLTASLLFRNFYVTPDNGLVILAEQFSRRSYSHSMYMSNQFGGGTYNNTSYTEYTCGDIYMAKVSGTGNVDWLHVLPKSQRELIQTGSSFSDMPMMPYNYFEPADNRPFYAGFSSVGGGRTIHIFFNDNQNNADILQPGKKVKRVNNNFGRTDCYLVELDMVTGKYTRKSLFSNKDIPTSMPRLGIALDNTMYLTGKEDRGFAKTKIVVGKIVCTL